MSNKLVVLDIDRTVCDSREFDSLFNSPGGLASWQAALQEKGVNLPLVTGAREAVLELAADPSVTFLFLTGRSYNCWSATNDWIVKNFPELVGRYELFTRFAGDESSNFISKSYRLQNFLALRPYKVVFMADDDVDMWKTVSKLDVGEFYHVKNCVWEPGWNKMVWMHLQGSR